MSLRVTAVAIIGDEHDWLETILKQWLNDGFRLPGDAEHDFALDLLAKLEPEPSSEPA